MIVSGKLLYYQSFSTIYAFCGNRSSIVMTNSSWTQNHLDQIWARKSAKIFPPCDVSAFTKLGKSPIVITVFDILLFFCNLFKEMAISKRGNMLMDSFPEIEQKRIPFQIMSLAQFRPEKNHKEGKNNYLNKNL